MGIGNIQAEVTAAQLAQSAAPTLAGLAGALADTLPTGSSVVVRWRDQQAGDGVSEAPHAPARLHARA